MRSIRVASGVVAITLVAATAASAYFSSAKDGERLRTLLGGKTGKTSVMPELTAQPTGLILSRCGITNEQLKEIRRYDVIVAGETAPVRAGFIDFTWRGKELRLGAAATSPGVPKALTAFDDFGKPVAELEPFLAQFKTPDGLLLNESSLLPIGDAMKARDAVMKSKDAPSKPQEREKWVLFRHKLLMWRMDEASERVFGSQADAISLPAGLVEMAKQIEAVSAFAGELRVSLKPKEIGQYRKFVGELKTNVEAAKAELDAGHAEQALKIAKSKVKLSCSQCHGWDANEAKKPLQGLLRGKRGDLGFKDGAFVVDYDVRPRDLPPEEAQAIACAVKAVLLLSQEK